MTPSLLGLLAHIATGPRKTRDEHQGLRGLDRGEQLGPQQPGLHRVQHGHLGGPLARLHHGRGRPAEGELRGHHGQRGIRRLPLRVREAAILLSGIRRMLIKKSFIEQGIFKVIARNKELLNR